jgi:hypothetical protein
LPEPPCTAFDLGGPGGLDVRVGLAIEAREQLGGQLGAFVDGEAKGARQSGGFGSSRRSAAASPGETERA